MLERHEKKEVARDDYVVVVDRVGNQSVKTQRTFWSICKSRGHKNLYLNVQKQL
jgi:hypothetical protein